MLHAKARQVVAVVAALVIVVLGGEALAAPPDANSLEVHVLSVKSDEALDQAEALTLALRKAVRDSQGWTLGDSQQSLEFLVLKMGCNEPLDAACEARIADVLSADRFVWAVIGFEEGNDQMVKGTLNFFVRGQGTKAVELRYSANLTDHNAGGLVEVAETKLAEVTGGPPKGTLRVTTGGREGQIFIDGEPLGALPSTGGSFQLSSGEHRVVVKSPGFADAEGTVEVKPASTVQLELALIAVEQDEPIDGRMVGGFAALGVGVAAGAVGLWASLEVLSVENDESFEEFRGFFQNTVNVCDEARNPSSDPAIESARTAVLDQCDKASTMEIVQAVSYPVAGVAAGLGLYLLGTSSLVGDDEGDAPSAWRVEPIISPEVQALHVRYRF